METGTRGSRGIKETAQGKGEGPRQVLTEWQTLKPDPQEGGGIFHIGDWEGIPGSNAKAPRNEPYLGKCKKCSLELKCRVQVGVKGKGTQG